MDDSKSCAMHIKELWILVTIKSHTNTDKQWWVEIGKNHYPGSTVAIRINDERPFMTNRKGGLSDLTTSSLIIQKPYNAATHIPSGTLPTETSLCPYDTLLAPVGALGEPEQERNTQGIQRSWPQPADGRQGWPAARLLLRCRGGLPAAWGEKGTP
jgi:hypothetical protein